MYNRALFKVTPERMIFKEIRVWRGKSSSYNTTRTSESQCTARYRGNMKAAHFQQQSNRSRCNLELSTLGVGDIIRRQRFFFFGLAARESSFFARAYSSSSSSLESCQMSCSVGSWILDAHALTCGLSRCGAGVRGTAHGA